MQHTGIVLPRTCNPRCSLPVLSKTDQHARTLWCPPSRTCLLLSWLVLCGDVVPDLRAVEAETRSLLLLAAARKAALCPGLPRPSVAW